MDQEDDQSSAYSGGDETQSIFDEDYQDAMSKFGGASAKGESSQGNTEDEGSDEEEDSFEIEFNMEETIMRGENALPSWVFDIEDDEDLEMASAYPNRSVSLLEELEIDLAQITYSVVWMLKCPFFILRKFVDLPTSSPFANSRYTCLRTLAAVWGRVADYNNHPIKIGKRRQGSVAANAARVNNNYRMEIATATEERSSEVDVMSENGLSTSVFTMPLGGQAGDSMGLGTRSRSRTNSENITTLNDVVPVSSSRGRIGSSSSRSGGTAAAATANGSPSSVLGKYFSTNGNTLKKDDDNGNGFDDLHTTGSGNHNRPAFRGSGVGSREGDEENQRGSSPRESDRLLAREEYDDDSDYDNNNNNSSSNSRGLHYSNSVYNVNVNHSDRDEKPFDFWGPCGVVTGYCAMLWLAGQEDVSYVYLIWILSSGFAHFTVRPFLEESSLLFHMAVLGYSLVPIIPLVFLIVISRMPSWACSLIESFAVTWGSIAAIMSYNTILRPMLESEREKGRLALLVPAALIFQLYAIAFMPTRRWQINNGEALKIL